MKTEPEQLKEQEKERDFFCVVSDAFGSLPVAHRSPSEAPGLLPEPRLLS